MNIDTGQIRGFTDEEKRQLQDFMKQGIPVGYDNMTPKQKREKFVSAQDHRSKLGKQRTQEIAKIGRNNPCPCGSGKKYKKCCLFTL